jgi:hypothetical protein
MGDSVQELRARRSTEDAPFITGAPAKARAAKRSSKKAEEAAATPLPGLDLGLAPRSTRKEYVTFAITTGQRDAIQRHAMARMEMGFTHKIELSAVLRDVLDHWLAHEKEVNVWISKTYNQGKG